MDTVNPEVIIIRFDGMLTDILIWLQFSLFENRRPSVGAAAFGNIKKSLTNSFENFMAKVPVSDIQPLHLFVLTFSVIYIYFNIIY